MMLEYRPLDEEKNEIRLITILPPAAQEGPEAREPSLTEPVKCLLEHASLNDYTPEYANFLKSDAASHSSATRSMIWASITKNRDYYVAEFESPEHVGNARVQALRHIMKPFYDDSKYRDEKKYNADSCRWNWGEFDALSYVWGDPNATRKIIVNGHDVNVTENLEDALRGLRGRLDKRKRHRIWIDALCINQADIPERNVQVRRMKALYEEADVVFAWLGCETKQSKLAFEFATDLVQAFSDSPEEGLKHVKSIQAQPCPYGEQTWKGLIELICCKYWSRLWIIQELAIANTEVTLVWGDQECLLIVWLRTTEAIMIHLLRVLLDRVKEICPAEDDLIERRLMQLGRLRGLDDYKYVRLHHPDLMMLLEIGRNAEAFDSRDKVYGLLGMIDPSISNLVAPDYNAHKSDVYQNFSRAVIKASRKLDIIYQGRLDTLQDGDLPSWVVDWLRQSKLAAMLLELKPQPRAAGDSKHDYESSNNEKHLVCKGLKFDTIGGLGCGLSLSHESPHQVVPSSISLKPINPYNNDEGIKNALWETFTFGQMTHLKPQVSAHFRSLPWFDGATDKSLRSPFYRYFDSFQTCNGTLEVAGKELKHYFPKQTEKFKIAPEETWDADLANALNVLMGTLDCKRLMTTKRGYVGSVPKNSQRRDLICVLLGCDYPVVLRPFGDAYKLVGDCYVHGITQGETILGLETGQYKLETITLC